MTLVRWDILAKNGNETWNNLSKLFKEMSLSLDCITLFNEWLMDNPSNNPYIIFDDINESLEFQKHNNCVTGPYTNYTLFVDTLNNNVIFLHGCVTYNCKTKSVDYINEKQMEESKWREKLKDIEVR